MSTDRGQYERDGYLIKRQFFSPDHIEDLKTQVNRIYLQWQQANAEELAKWPLVNMSGLSAAAYFDSPQQRAHFFSALSPTALIDLTAELFGDGIHFHNSQLFFNPQDRSKAPYWHRDMQYDKTPDAEQAAELASMLSLHVRIPLLAERGLELIPGTHCRWDTPLERQVRLELNGHRNSEDLPDSVLLSLQPGDLVIFHAQMIHRGNYLLNQARWALDLCIGTPHRLTTPHINPQFMPSDTEIPLIEDPRWYRRALALIERCEGP